MRRVLPGEGHLQLIVRFTRFYCVRISAAGVRFRQRPTIETWSCLDEASRMTAPFPCRHLNGGEWINVDLGTRMRGHPIIWRVWQRTDSPQPHHSVHKRVN